MGFNSTFECSISTGWSAYQVQMALGWTEDGCGCWDVVEPLGKEFLVGELADRRVAGG